uniref:Ig-like domain-containing protein n=1 Tax=Neovison vison TaxID=452646 RepID=A0A8C7ETV1_NEOVI
MSPRVISLACLGEVTPSQFTTSMFLGIYRKPSLLAQSGRLVKSRGNVTLVCCSEILFESFILHREGVSKDHLYRAGQHHHGGSHANFSMGPVTAAHAGTYRCFGSLNHSSHVWSAPSDPLDIMITGETVQTCPHPLGDTDKTWKPQVVKKVRNVGFYEERHFRARLACLRLVTDGPWVLTACGTHRCCMHSHTPSSHVPLCTELPPLPPGLHEKPSLWTQPGTVVRTGENVTLSCCSERSFDVYHLSRDEQPHECWLAKGQKHGSATQADFPLGPAHPAIGGTYRCHGSFNPSPCEWSGPSDPLFLSVTGEEVQNLPYGSRLGTCLDLLLLDSFLPTDNPRHQHVLAVPLVVIVFLAVLLFFLSRQWCPPKEDAAIMNREPEVDRMVSREVGSEDPQEVTYTQLDHRIFMQKNTTPTSQRPGEPLHDESVYMELATG